MKRILFIISTVLITVSCGRQDNSVIIISKENGLETFFKLDANGNRSVLLPQKQKVAYPVLSPDNSKIAYMSEDSGNWNIHIFNLRTNTEIISASGPSIESFPTWSPDGSKIAYMANRGNNRDIYVSNPDGSGEKRITTSESIDSQPLWSPSLENRIYFKSLRKEYEGVFYKETGQDSTYEIAPAGGANDFLKSVPGMPEISFVHHSAKESSFIIFDEESNQIFSLLTTEKRITGYAWSPDAKKVAVSIQGQTEVYDYSNDTGLDLDFIIPHAAYPAWSRDSNRLYYNKRIDGVLQVFEYEIGKNLEKQITHGPADSTDIVSY